MHDQVLTHAYLAHSRAERRIADSEEQVRLAVANWILKRSEEPWLQLFIFDRHSGQFIGGTGFHHLVWEIPSVETGYWIRNSHAGKGLMTEAMNAMTQYAFRQLQVKRIAISCDVDNHASRKIPERLNYTLEGRLKHHRRKPVSGELSDTLVFAKYNLDNLPPLVVMWG